MKPIRMTDMQRAAALACTALVATLAQAGDAIPQPAEKAPWSWDMGYKADLLHRRVEGVRGNDAVGNYGLRVNADAGALFGWDGVTLHTEALLNHGGKPNRHVGSTQGITNLEVAESAGRLYATWLEKDFGDGTALLAGLYDLNSDFYATSASGLLIHPSFGIGIDFSQSGRNGPSIFPNLGLALRGKMQLGSSHYAQIAVIDGVPGDPAHPGRTTVRLSKHEGALLVGEAGWQPRGADGPLPERAGIGLWGYTQRSDRLDGTGTERNHGVYALAQALLRDSIDARTTGFVRAGLANRRINAVETGADAGVLVERPFGDRGPAALTAGLAVARYGRAHRDARALDGTATASHETALEIGARWQPWGGVAVQPLIQRIWNVGGQPGVHATIAGLRLEWAYDPAAAR